MKPEADPGEPGVEGVANPPLSSICLVFCLLDPSSILGQPYDGTSVMSSGKVGVQAKIKEISPLALFTRALLCSLPEPLHRSNMQTVSSAKFDRSY